MNSVSKSKKETGAAAAEEELDVDCRRDGALSNWQYPLRKKRSDEEKDADEEK